MSDKPILFYSPSCNHCVNLWKKLKSKNILNSIIKINVNNTKNLPKSVKSVPTLIIRGRAPIIGEAVEFYFNSSNVQTNNVNQRPISTKGGTESRSAQGPIGDFFPCEMGNNWSDNYSFIGTDKPLDHRYSFLDSGNSGIPSQNEINSLNSSTKSGNSLSSRLEEYKKARSNDLRRT